MDIKVRILTEEEYLSMKERLLGHLLEQLDLFVSQEQADNPHIEKSDFVHAQMEVFSDVAASAAIETGDVSRGEFLDLTVDSYDNMLDVALENASPSELVEKTPQDFRKSAN